MCLILFYINPDAGPNDLYLILVSVRDEVYSRPTKLAEFWENFPHVIGGRDAEPGKEGGTWFAMSKTGRIGALLNVLQPDEAILPWKKGRGFLAADFVTNQKDCLQYLQEIYHEGDKYNEFLLVTLDCTALNEPKLACYTNSSSTSPVLLSPGIHAFGNSVTPETPWPKVSKAKEKFSYIIKKYPSTSTKEALVNELFTLLKDPTRYSMDENMKRQGKSKSVDFLNKLSAVFVHIPESNYGSRCHTVVLIDGTGNVDYYENSRTEELSLEGDANWLLHHHIFKVNG